AIGAAGTSAYERASLGLPTIMIKLADNQSENMKSFNQSKAALTINEWPAESFESLLLEHLETLFGDSDVYKSMVSQCFKTVSPLGLLNALGKVFSGSLIKLRPAEEKDLKTVYSWQKFPGARQFSRNKSIPTFEEHTGWFNNSLKSESRQMFILEAAQAPVGFLRLDQKEKNEVSILINHAFYGCGLGKKGLELLRFEFPDIDLHAFIEEENAASHRVFKSSGYKEMGSGWYINTKN
ncbi:MAG: GNAT family N-acetyltransferase, partial [Bdellovibrionales bacterium]|nr:GNAT family N-acetyltransferase [Bdellovibrionales bacterium]